MNSAFNDIKQRIAAALQACQRNPDSVRVVAISKGQPVRKMQQLIAAGQYAFGENYLQEALAKIAALPDTSIEWHFVGAIQANKTRAIAENFAWVHGVDRLAIAKRLNAQRPAHLPPLNICIAVNISGEPQKSGITPEALPAFAAALQPLSRLNFRGLMTLPKASHDFANQRLPYHHLQQLFLQLQAQGFAIDTLSMGMSEDFVAAIYEGSTIVRIGTALFGPRENQK